MWGCGSDDSFAQVPLNLPPTTTISSSTTTTAGNLATSQQLVDSRGNVLDTSGLARSSGVLPSFVPASPAATLADNDPAAQLPEAFQSALAAEARGPALLPISGDSSGGDAEAGTISSRVIGRDTRSAVIDPAAYPNNAQVLIFSSFPKNENFVAPTATTTTTVVSGTTVTLTNTVTGTSTTTTTNTVTGPTATTTVTGPTTTATTTVGGGTTTVTGPTTTVTTTVGGGTTTVTGPTTTVTTTVTETLATLKVGEPDNTITFVGSGTFIGPRHILTCAHNIYSAGTVLSNNDPRAPQRFATQIMVAPGYTVNPQGKGKAPYGMVQATGYYFASGYPQTGAAGLDYAILELPADNLLGNRLGYLGVKREDQVGTRVGVNLAAYSNERGTAGSYSLLQAFGSLGGLQSGVWSNDVDCGPGSDGAAAYVLNKGSNERSVVGIQAFYNDASQLNGATSINPALFDAIRALARAGQ